LKITDFGLGRFHGRDSRSGIDPRKVATSPTYEPPECTIGRPVSRAYDIWSLACLYLEFVTWMLSGNQQIEEFGDDRGREIPKEPFTDDNFFTVFIDDNHERNAVVREAVIQWVRGLHAHKNCSELIHDLLNLIMGAMLKVDPAERIKACDLAETMKELVKRAESSYTYLVEPAPWPLPPPKASTGSRVRFADPPAESISQTRQHKN